MPDPSKNNPPPTREELDRTVGTLDKYLQDNKTVKYKNPAGGGTYNYKLKSGLDHFKKTGTVETMLGNDPVTFKGKKAEELMNNYITEASKKRHKDYDIMRRNLGKDIKLILE